MPKPKSRTPMIDFHLQIPTKIMDWVDEQINSGFYRSRTEVIMDTLRKEAKKKEEN
ncbi:unnamed protein product [marine sediment metagenome]|uniref:Ribbon-helix-helix protein CopG domain-containing protein n=1 Tax=marine sediment metagenome TaxID=412755 RepID=X1C8D7_9ZZZZ